MTLRIGRHGKFNPPTQREGAPRKAAWGHLPGNVVQLGVDCMCTIAHGVSKFPFQDLSMSLLFVRVSRGAHMEAPRFLLLEVNCTAAV